MLVPLYTYHFSTSEYGVVAEFYAYAGFISVFAALGFETGYFRYCDKKSLEKDVVYSTAFVFVGLMNVGFFVLIFGCSPWLMEKLHYKGNPEYMLYFAIIILLDALAVLPMARLRMLERAYLFASIKIIEILSTVLFSLFFIVYCPSIYEQNPDSWVKSVYDPLTGVGYVFIANLFASFLKFLVLLPQFSDAFWGFEKALFLKMFNYSLPMMVIGFAGVINEMLDRVLLKLLLPYDVLTNTQQLGIYSACYKLSILMSLFVQAFRYAAEPLFFSYADKTDAQRIYAKVLNYFVIFCIFIFLIVTLFIDFFKFFIGEDFRAGLSVVPILLLANLFLGIYVNLSVWYKLTDRTRMGARVAIAGSVLTIILNFWWIPWFGYLGSAWATLVCYGCMAAASYVLGQRYYPVPYELKKILGYLGVGILLYWLHGQWLISSHWQSWQTASMLLIVYCLTVTLFEFRGVRSMSRALR